jgi:serine/threonine-protein kinase RsbW
MPRNSKFITINSETVRLNEIDIFVEDVFNCFGLSHSDFHRTMLCVKEAVTNSIVHGNKLDRNKQVTIMAYKCSKFLYFKIIDEGDGFDFSAVSDPTCLENILKESGRGLFLIKNTCDGITFKEKGNIVEIKINIHEKY